MMMQNQINNFLREIIPLSDISRFAISDWRNTFNLALILISVITLENILAKKLAISNIKIILITIGFFYMLYLGYRYEFSLLKILFYSIPVILILLYLLFFLKTWHIKPLIIFTICFNYLFVIDNSLSWLTTVKEQYFNIYKKDYSIIKETIIYPLEKRSKRFFFIDPPLTSDEYKSDQRYNRFWLTGGFGALGYHNIKDIPEYRSLFPRLERPNDPLIKFLTLQGKQLILTDQQQSENLLSDCVNKSTCNFDPQIQVKQLEFNKESEIFRINSNKEFRMIQNEMYSPVWTGQLCEADSKCLELKPYASFESLRSWNLPKGEYIFKTTAQTPLNKERWVLFSIGLLISLSNLGMKLFNYRGPNIKSKNISS
jgi:hypothetical protein